MKITVELNDFWLDEEHELEPALRQFVIRDVTNQIEKSIKEKIEEHITRKVKADIEERMYRFMNLTIEEIIKTESINHDGKQVPLTEYIKIHFNSRNGSWRNADETIAKVAKQFADEMKNRYDLLFASQLVAKMNSNGLLKEDVAKLLLEKQVKS